MVPIAPQSLLGTILGPAVQAATTVVSIFGAVWVMRDRQKVERRDRLDDERINKVRVLCAELLAVVDPDSYAMPKYQRANHIIHELEVLLLPTVEAEERLRLAAIHLGIQMLTYGGTVQQLQSGNALADDLLIDQAEAHAAEGKELRHRMSAFANLARPVCTRTVAALRR